MSAEAYGYDSLAYTAEPVMQICVWQRNGRRVEDYPGENYRSADFYNVVPLELKEGATVLTNIIPIVYEAENEFNARRYVSSADEVCISVTFDGNIIGEYDEILSLYYGSDLSVMPDGVITNENGQAKGIDGKFSKPEKLILSFKNQLYALSGLELNDLKEESRKVYEKVIDERELFTGLKYKDFYKTESYTDVYPEEDDKWRTLERGVLTSRVKIKGIDPLKPEIVLCEAELEIKSYSGWLIENLSRDLCDEFCRTKTDMPHSSVTVISYTQSDKFAE